MIRLQNDPLSRILHQSLYDRMLSFCKEYSPELPGEPIVTAWLNRLYLGDSNLHILVTLDDKYNITEHIVIDVQDMYWSRVVVCHQAYWKKPNLEAYNEGIEYIDKLVQHANAYCSLFFVAKNSKVLEKKYGYRTVRSVMIKLSGDVDNT